MRLSPLSLLAALSLALLALPSLPLGAKETPPATAPARGGKEVTPADRRAGSVEDETLQKAAPAGEVITDEKGLADLWKAWKLEGEPPKVDFKQHLVAVQTTRGSRLNVRARLTDDGDLRVVGMATRDLRPGFRYEILVLPREGVKTVNGKPLREG